MKYFVILGIIGISLLSSYLQETEARTIAPLSIWLDEDTIKQNSFIIADSGVPDIIIQKGDTVSFPLTISPHGSEPLPVNFFHSMELAIPDTRQLTLPDMQIELDPFHMVLKPDEPQIMNVSITTLNYTQLGEHKIKLTAQYPQGEVLLNTRFNVLVTDENQYEDSNSDEMSSSLSESLVLDVDNAQLDDENYRFIDFTYANIKGDPIQFILERTALGDCTSFQAEIINEDGNVVWGEGSFALCDPIANPSLITSQIKIGYNENNPIVIDEFGYYILKVQIDDGIITKEFIVKPKSSVSIDRTVYPIPFGIQSPLKQLQMGISINEIQCKETLLLIKKHDGSPACVTPESAIVLYERDWTLTLHVAVNRSAPSVYLGPTDIPSANNQFALNFYSHVTQDNKNNVFFSPTSIFTAFAIAYEGAKGNTATEMEDVFGFESDESKRRIGFADMQEQLNMKQQNNTISLANALWVAENFEVLPEYMDTAKTYYDSDVESINFSSKEKGVDLINSWVDKKTHGKIKKIFEKLDPSTKLVITNAIYFKGIWEDPFDKTKTTVGDFHVSLDNTVQVPMMQSKTTFPNVAVNDLVQLVELPYEGENFSMLILLPRDVDGMNSLEESLSVDGLNKWKGELKKMKTKVYMPKFELETEYDLKSILQEMGIHDAFGNADFTGISNSGLYIEKAAHKAFVEVTEEGTEAAAATGMAMPSSGPFEFIVDRSFIFIIQDNATESILFIGKVVDPLQ